jgi:aminopeptidase N
MLLNDPMNPLDLTINQLKRAAALKEQVEALNKELGSILGASAKSGSASKKKRTMSASAKKKIAAAQRARWSNLRRANPATSSVKPAAATKKKTMSRATKAKLSAKLKAFWAAKRAGKK